MATNAETIDSLLVSLGLDVDQKSFQKATGAINDIKNKSLQLLAAAGIGAGFDAWTRGVARYTGEIESLAFATKATTRDVEALRYAFKAQGLAAGEADSALRRMADVQRNIQLGILPAFPGSDVLIGKTPVQMLKILSDMLPGMNEQMRLIALQEMGIAPGSSTHQMLTGGGFGKKFESAQAAVTGISPELSAATKEFNQQMTDLQTSFTGLSKVVGGPLINELNNLLKTANDFIKENKEEIGIAVSDIFSGAWYDKLMQYTEEAGERNRAMFKSSWNYAKRNIGDALEAIGIETDIGRKNLREIREHPSWMDWLHGGPGKVMREASKNDAVELPPLPAKVARSSAPGGLMDEFTRASQKHGVPVDILLGMAKQESGFNPSAMGPQTKWGRAQGIMQYLSGTAASLGIDPLDPSQAIDAAAKQIRERLDMGESIEDAIAHHHAGPNRALWGAKTADYVEKVTGHAAGFRGIEDSMAFVQGAYSSPSDSLPGSSYSPTTQTFEQTNYVTIQSTGNPVQDQQLYQLYTRNWGDSLKSDIY